MKESGRADHDGVLKDLRIPKAKLTRQPRRISSRHRKISSRQRTGWNVKRCAEIKVLRADITSSDSSQAFLRYTGLARGVHGSSCMVSQSILLRMVRNSHMLMFVI